MSDLEPNQLPLFIEGQRGAVRLNRDQRDPGRLFDVGDMAKDGQRQIVRNALPGEAVEKGAGRGRTRMSAVRARATKATASLGDGQVSMSLESRGYRVRISGPSARAIVSDAASGQARLAAGADQPSSVSPT